ncbi:MAG: outer membrane beta-barrel protein [Methylobacterium frigidaeris]
MTDERPGDLPGGMPSGVPRQRSGDDARRPRTGAGAARLGAFRHGRLVAAALGLVLVGDPARAQLAGGTTGLRLDQPAASAASPARAGAPVSRNDGPGAAAPTASPARTSSERASSARTPTRPPPQRRTRPPTTALTRQVTQIPPESVSLRNIVQIPVSGLPDIAASGAPLLRRRIDPLDPYGPVGIRVGNVLLFPALQQSVGYDTNPDRAAVPKASVAFRTDGELRVLSDWSSHQLTGDMRIGYLTYPDNRAANRPDGDGTLRLRVDAARDTRLEVEGRYLVTTQRTGSPDLGTAVRDRPIVTAYGGTVGVVQDFSRLQVSLRGLVDRQTFEDAVQLNGVVVPQSDRNANQYGVRMRTGYELRPGFTPFVDVLLDTRIHDRAVDFFGFRRDSDGINARVGSTFTYSQLLSGEVSGGVLSRSYVDPRLRTLTGPVIDGAVIWAVTPLTSVRLAASTGVAETIVPNASGILNRTAIVEVTHDLRRNLRLSLIGIAYENEYQGVSILERGYSAGLRLDYRLNRWLGFRASYTHERLKSTVSFSNFESHTVLFGVRVNP